MVNEIVTTRQILGEEKTLADLGLHGMGQHEPLQKDYVASGLTGRHAATD